MRTLLLPAVFILLLAGCPGPTRQATSGPSEAGETWLTTELAGQRIGHSVTRVERFEAGWRFESVMQLQIAMMGVQQQVSARSVSTTAPDLTLQTMTFRFEAQGRSMEAVAAVQENSLIIKPVGDRPRVLKLDGPVYPTEAIGRLALQRGSVSGSTFDVSIFDPATMAVDRVTVQVEGWETVRVGVTSYHTLRLVTRSSAFAVTTWLDSSGLTVIEEAPPGIRSVRATPAAAIAGAGEQSSVDLLRMFRVEVDAAVSDPSVVRRARLAVTGIVSSELPADAGDVTVFDAESLVVEVVATGPPLGRLELPVAGQDSFLTPSVTIQCDAPEMAAKVAEVVADKRDAATVARVLARWVHDNVEKVPTASFPTALDVLRNLRGDCNEHAVLYAGLARAAGLPCRVAVGLVYLQGAFYYHAWNEVWLGRWVMVDPTFDEFPANALRLKLGGGDLREQSRILPLVGRIGIRVLEYD
jgi:hypothetical protein